MPVYGAQLIFKQNKTLPVFPAKGSKSSVATAFKLYQSCLILLHCNVLEGDTCYYCPACDSCLYHGMEVTEVSLAFSCVHGKRLQMRIMIIGWDFPAGGAQLVQFRVQDSHCP